MTHKVTFLPMEATVEVDEVLYPYARTGEPGSLLDIALSHGVGIMHVCGGTGVCGSCRVGVEKGMENLSEPDEAELDQLDAMGDSKPNDRLACKAVVHGDVTVRIPPQ
ncbi:MAG: (2Fe-2S)-binding protein [Planctomycetaceae bacterium]|nr:(2Fe-2S)-binding protein [Planctomycetaceae bacterium]